MKALFFVFLSFFFVVNITHCSEQPRAEALIATLDDLLKESKSLTRLISLVSFDSIGIAMQEFDYAYRKLQRKKYKKPRLY